MARQRDLERKKARLTLEMSQKTREDLDGLRERTGAVSAAEVVKRALAVYDFVNSEIQAGKVLVLRSEDGSEERVRIV